MYFFAQFLLIRSTRKSEFTRIQQKKKEREKKLGIYNEEFLYRSSIESKYLMAFSVCYSLFNFIMFSLFLLFSLFSLILAKQDARTVKNV